ncbi:MAG: glycosyltransferase family 2 protein [Verrucomicrobiota bacterium]
MSLSIVIVNWNSKDYLRNCLQSIRRTCDGLDPQIIVVDGGSFDGCDKMLAKEFAEVEFIQSKDNIGFGRSNNLGFTRVAGEMVLLLNPDTELGEGSLQTLILALEQDLDCGMVGARLLNSDGSLQESSIHPLPTPLNTALDSDWLRRRWWARQGPRFPGPSVAVEAVSGACMLMRSETFRRVGGFSPQYFMYAEDMDLCLKVHRAGLKILHVANAQVLHHGGGSSQTQFSKFSSIMIREALYVYMRLNHGFFAAASYRCLQGISATLRIALLAPLWILGSGQARQARKVSIHKWWVVLRWCLGMEQWSKERFGCSKSSRNGIAEMEKPGQDTTKPSIV